MQSRANQGEQIVVANRCPLSLCSTMNSNLNARRVVHPQPRAAVATLGRSAFRLSPAAKDAPPARGPANRRSVERFPAVLLHCQGVLLWMAEPEPSANRCPCTVFE
jgi:hypothetical protein